LSTHYREWLLENELRQRQEEAQKELKMRDELLEQVHKENMRLRQQMNEARAEIELAKNPISQHREIGKDVSLSVPVQVLDFLEYLAIELKSCPPNRVAPLRRDIDQSLRRLIRTITGANVEFTPDAKRNQNDPIHLGAIAEAIAKLKASDGNEQQSPTPEKE
jgi:hypothetical protein